MGVFSGMALMVVIRRIREDQEALDAESISKSISERLSVLEGEMSAS